LSIDNPFYSHDFLFHQAEQVDRHLGDLLAIDV
jgi:hypothetical protein